MNPSIAEIRAHIDTLADKLGLPLDEGIIEAVVGLQANGLPTRQSCEGHLERGLAFPWVDICEPDGDADANRALHIKLDALLKEYYNLHPLDTHSSGLGYGVLAESQAMRLMHMPMPSRNEKDAKHLALYRSEMNSFAEFLIERATRNEPASH